MPNEQPISFSEFVLVDVGPILGKFAGRFYSIAKNRKFSLYLEPEHHRFKDKFDYEIKSR